MSQTLDQDAIKRIEKRITMQKKQNGYKVIYKINNPIEIINSFIFQTKSKNKAIEYAKKFTSVNGFKLIEVVDNI
tara:strand:+ start:188 stop:412 length:225 start_codon:yes stop_codon:yes gene_type:complete